MMNKTRHACLRSLQCIFLAALLCLTIATRAEERLDDSGSSSDASVASASAAVPPNLDDVANLTSFIDGVLAVSMEQFKVPGAVISIVKDGRLLFAKGYGSADIASGRKVDPGSSIFRIGSIAKLFTWTAVMQLVEGGKLDLDTDVNNYLDSFKLPATYPQPITMRHLMTHTAGFEEGGMGYVIVTDPQLAQLSIAEALAAHVPARIRPPGELTSYSNYGAALAALIVERVSGVPFDEYVRQHIFEPLGMRHTTFKEPLPEHLRSFGVTGYVRENGEYVPKPFQRLGGFYPAGGASSTAEDMARFMLACLQDGSYENARILTSESAQRMRATHVQFDPRLPGIPLGFFKWRKNDLEAFGHGGDMTLFRSYLAFVPERQVGIFMSFVGPGGAPARDALAAKFFDYYFPAAPAPIPQVTSEAVSSPGKYAGSYQWTRRNQSKIDKFFNLTMQIDVAELPNGRVLVNSPDLPEPLPFSPLGSDLFQQVDGPGRMVFRTDAAGMATNMFFDFAPYMPTERTPWHERSGLWFSLLAVCAIVFLSTLTAHWYGRKEIRALPAPQRRALRLSATTAAGAFVTILALIAPIVVYSETFMNDIPAALKLALALPLIFLALTTGCVYVAFQAWSSRWWTVGRRLKLTAVALAALCLSLFFWKWNLLGWQFG